MGDLVSLLSSQVTVLPRMCAISTQVGTSDPSEARYRSPLREIRRSASRAHNSKIVVGLTISTLSHEVIRSQPPANFLNFRLALFLVYLTGIDFVKSCFWENFVRQCLPLGPRLHTPGIARGNSADTLEQFLPGVFDYVLILAYRRDICQANFLAVSAGGNEPPLVP